MGGINVIVTVNADTKANTNDHHNHDGVMAMAQRCNYMTMQHINQTVSAATGLLHWHLCKVDGGIGTTAMVQWHDGNGNNATVQLQWRRWQQQWRQRQHNGDSATEQLHDCKMRMATTHDCVTASQQSNSARVMVMASGSSSSQQLLLLLLLLFHCCCSTALLPLPCPSCHCC